MKNDSIAPEDACMYKSRLTYDGLRYLTLHSYSTFVIVVVFVAVLNVSNISFSHEFSCVAYAHLTTKAVISYLNERKTKQFRNEEKALKLNESAIQKANEQVPECRHDTHFS